MHAIDQRQRFLLQRFGGSNVGKDHELFDELVRIEPLGDDHAIDRAVCLEKNFSLGNVEVERIAFVARALHQRIGCVERLQNRHENRAGGVIGAAVDRGLRLRVIQLRGRAHQHTMKRVTLLAAVWADHHPNGERASRLARHQRTQIVRDALRKHRHDAVGEIDRIAADQRVAIERRPRPYIKRDIRDRNADDEAALIGWVLIRLGIDGVVMVLRIRRIDRHQRHVTPVLAALQRRRFGGFGLFNRAWRKRLRNFVAVDRDQADGFFGRERAESFFHLC